MHTINIREEKLLIRQGNDSIEYRATCSCGWTEKSTSHQKVDELAARHANMPHRA
jgi:hypothetical protein